MASKKGQQLSSSTIGTIKKKGPPAGRPAKAYHLGQTKIPTSWGKGVVRLHMEGKRETWFGTDHRKIKRRHSELGYEKRERKNLSHQLEFEGGKKEFDGVS